ncbi:hypothetical protein QJS04_geneDACA008552 [Acorus gramineus]|uniref:Uncharacterized protein n=1 Tax=Acorus gramineus TaxID=55184 RepID=A0AAV9AH85_ACOGR|nr:hypothetical protein QJS04_geneDACA008552 [Acorus gramineus]
MMSRPMVLVFLLVLLIVTSQFEWKQPLVNEMDPGPRGLSVKQQRILKKEEVVKEKIILSQERTIHKLNELVQTLQQQLLQCQSNNSNHNNNNITTNAPKGDSLAVNINELDRQQILED